MQSTKRTAPKPIRQISSLNERTIVTTAAIFWSALKDSTKDSLQQAFLASQGDFLRFPIQNSIEQKCGNNPALVVVGYELKPKL